MKIVLLISILFCAIAMPALGELADADLDKIRLIVKEEVQKEINNSKTRMKEHINTKNESIDKRLSLVTTLIGGLIALIVLAVGIPQIFIAWRSRTDRIQSQESFEKLFSNWWKNGLRNSPLKRGG